MNKNEMKILICDDSILARKSLRDLLKDMGYSDILEVTNGQDAVDRYKSDKPDVVFIDIIMPVKDGITATREINAFYPAARIIMCSSVGTQTHVREAIKAGAKDFIQKPVTVEVLTEVLGHIA